MNTLLVTSTAEGTGKTAISLALARLARERGLDVGYMKPKGTRLRSAVGKTRDEDPLLAAELLDLDAPLETLEPVVYSPTFLQEAVRGRQDPDELRERVVTAFETLATDVDLMFVEGGGERRTGGIVELTDADVADLLDATVLLVTKYREEQDLDDVLAAAETLGDRLGGVLFNVVAESARDDVVEYVAPFLAGRGIETLGVLPRDQDLAGVSVAELADSLGAEVIAGEATAETRLERVAVGAPGGDAALDRFRRLRDAAVVTGGDRSDVHTAAIAAPGVACLVLSGGYRPPSVVLGRATDRGLPVLLVRTDTRTTVDRVEELLTTGRTHNAVSVARMADMLEAGVDLDRLLST